MSETITTYALNKPDDPQPMDRDKFYREQVESYKKTGKPTRAIAIVNAFIFNPKGELFIQKRSDQKAHNPGLLDKSIGGHIRFGDSPDYTIMVETIQELQVPSITLLNRKDFLKTYELLGSYLSVVSIVQHIDTKMLNLKKTINNEEIIIANKTHIYFGIYNGSMRTVDREAKGILQYTLPELEKEIKQSPNSFTNDIVFYLKNYKKEFEDFINIISK
jgi:isopentenyldiphosphate isomerase